MTAFRATFDRWAYGRPVSFESATVRTAARPATALVGRIFLAAIFILSGLAKFLDYDTSLSHLAGKGVPWAGGLLIIAALVEVGGGLAVATGTVTRLGALALVAFLVPTTLIFHDFWALAGPEKTGQMAHFMKNVAIAGGLLQLVAYGGGRFSVDHKRHHG